MFGFPWFVDKKKDEGFSCFYFNNIKDKRNSKGLLEIVGNILNMNWSFLVPGMCVKGFGSVGKLLPLDPAVKRS